MHKTMHLSKRFNNSLLIFFKYSVSSFWEEVTVEHWKMFDEQRGTGFSTGNRIAGIQNHSTHRTKQKHKQKNWHCKRFDIQIFIFLFSSLLLSF